MQGKPDTWWGKLTRNPEGEVASWHPLVDHCIDVAAVTEALLALPEVAQPLARLAGWPALAPVHAARLAFLAGLHDLGKFNHGFQAKALAAPHATAGHVKEALGLLDNSERTDRLVEALDWKALAAWGDEATLGLLLASLCHHGRPWPLGQPVAPGIWAPHPRDPFAGIAGLARHLGQGLSSAFGEAPAFPSGAPFQHAFSGLVMLADWIGSDTRFFPFSEARADRWPTARAGALRALEGIGLDVRAARKALGEAPPPFEALVPFSPRGAQEPILGLPTHEPGSLTLIEAETGAGKTEAALARYLRLFHAGVAGGLFFALPTRTSATQIHARVTQAVQRAFPAHARPPVVLAVPGYFRVDDHDGQALPGFEVLWNDEAGDQARERGWAAERPKRYLAGPVVVGTVDQLLLSALVVPHAHLRATASLRHVLVVDEVHASDAYMTRILEAVLTRHREAGGHALLMSATLGEEARHRLFRGTRRPQAQAAAQPYPAVTYRAEGGSGTLIPVPSGNGKHTRVELAAIQPDPQAIAQRALAAAEGGARVLVIRNTVAGCLAVQEALEALTPSPDLLFALEGKPAPHHSRFAAEDRRRLDEGIESAFGRAAPGGGKVVAATQTVEQSLDLDADLLITDLCPMDVLLQRVGRLHRHPRADRPAGCTEPRVVVLTPPQPDLGAYIGNGGHGGGPHGLGTVYPDLRVLQATWEVLLRDPWLRVPQESRALVEAATHREVLDALGARSASWRRHATTIDGEVRAMRSMGQSVLLDWAIPFGGTGSGFPPPEVLGRVTTRLGADDRAVHLDPPLPGPFGTSVQHLRIPARQARNSPPDATPVDVQPTASGLTFSFGGHPFVYDRHGLRPLQEVAS